MTDEETTGPSQSMMRLFAEHGEPPASEAEVAPDEINGRFAIAEKLGAGAMGVVYKAYDRTLERTIALKLVAARSGGSRGQARLLREALALARLNHPNVVGVYDVGEMDDGRVWVGMEFVDGVTLVEWLKDRPSWREVVRVIGFVADGLAAAHAEKLVHRDLKPGNVMIDRKGRVRVMDFGLAALTAADVREAETRSSAEREPLTMTGAVLGTPAYMAPEQCAGLPADHRADQFSLCVTMWEAIYGERLFDAETANELSAKIRGGVLRSPPAGVEVPAWLHRVMMRGLSVDPEQRFPAISALRAAIEKGQARMRTWRRARGVLLGLGGVGAIALAVIVAQKYERAERVAACEASGGMIGALWNEEREEQLRSSLLATGVPFAASTVDKILPSLGRWADEWSRARTAVCLQAEVEEQLPQHLYERARACLDDGRLELESLLLVFSAATKADVINAVRAATRLSQPANCSDRARLERRPTPAVGTSAPPAIAALRRDLFAARGMEAAGRYGGGLELAEKTLRSAEALEHLPTIVEARYVAGRLAGWDSKLELAEELLARSFTDAGAIGLDDVAARSASELAYTVGYEGARGDEGLRWARSAEMFVRRIGEQDSLLGAEILANEGSVEQARGEYVRAQALAERALEIQEREMGSVHTTIAFTLNNLAAALNSQGKYEPARAAFARGLAIVEQTHGPDHLVVAMFLNNLAGFENTVGAHEDGAKHVQRALAIQEAALGPDDPQVAFTLVNLGNSTLLAGHPAKAREYIDRALAIQTKVFGADHPLLIRTMSSMGKVLRRASGFAEAEAMQSQALALGERTLGAEHPDVASVLVTLGILYEDNNDPLRARAYYERALAVYEKLETKLPSELATVILNIADVDETEGNYDAAEKGYERAFEIRTALYGESHRELADVLVNRAVLDYRRGHHEAAEERIRQALAMYAETIGRDHVEVSLPLVDLATILQAQGQHEEALQQLERARSLVENNPDEDRRRMTAVQVGLGISGVALGRAHEVIPGLEQALKSRHEDPGATAEDRLTVRFVLAQALWDAPDEAGRDRIRALQLAQEAMKESGGLRGTQRKVLSELKEWLRSVGGSGRHAGPDPTAAIGG